MSIGHFLFRQESSSAKTIFLMGCDQRILVLIQLVMVVFKEYLSFSLKWLDPNTTYPEHCSVSLRIELQNQHIINITRL